MKDVVPFFRPPPRSSPSFITVGAGSFLIALDCAPLCCRDLGSLPTLSKREIEEKGLWVVAESFAVASATV